MTAIKLRRATVLAICLCASTAWADEDLYWEINVTPFNQIFPMLELSQPIRTKTTGAARDHVMGNGLGLIAVRVNAGRPIERLHLKIESPYLDKPSELDADLQESGEYELHPQFDWNISKLSLVSTATDETLNVQLQINGGVVESRKIKVNLRPLNEALYYVRDGKDAVDLSWVFAAYVDEGNAVVSHILEQARSYAITDRFDGYDSGDAEQVYRQIWAIWQALEKRGIRYSDADPAIERGPNVYSQRVRFLGQTWNDRTANCIDGSVLLGSVLQRLGIHSFLVLIPGHAFIGIYTDSDNRNAVYLETTVLGETNLPRMKVIPHFAEHALEEEGNRKSLVSFSAALKAGGARYAKVRQKFTRNLRPDYVVVDLATARTYGILPIDVAAGKAEPLPVDR